jgi:two-component system invasion response regulator UvrY
MTTASAAPTQLGVLLVDDQAPFLQAARSLLEAEGRYQVLAEAHNGEEAVALAHQLQPQLILMDVRLPGISGIEATRRILASHPHVVIVLLSTHSEADLPTDLLRCGAAGFLRKESLDPTTLESLVEVT